MHIKRGYLVVTGLKDHINYSSQKTANNTINFIDSVSWHLKIDFFLVQAFYSTGKEKNTTTHV